MLFNVLPYNFAKNVHFLRNRDIAVITKRHNGLFTIPVKIRIRISGVYSKMEEEGRFFFFQIKGFWGPWDAKR
jgi:hypothetical protein